MAALKEIYVVWGNKEDRLLSFINLVLLQVPSVAIVALVSNFLGMLVRVLITKVYIIRAIASTTYIVYVHEDYTICGIVLSAV